MKYAPKASFGSLNLFRLIGFMPGPILFIASFFYKKIADQILDGLEPKFVLGFLLGMIVVWMVLGAVALWLSANLELFFAYRFLEIQDLIGQAPKKTSVFGYLLEMHETMKISSKNSLEVRKYMGPYIDGSMEAAFTTLKPGENVTLMNEWKKNHDTYKKNNPLGNAS